MARTRGAKSSSPSSRLRIPRGTPGAPMSPPVRRYQTGRSLTMAGASSSRAKKSGSGPPKKKAKGAPAGPEHPDQPVEIPVDTPPPAPAVASTEHILEVAPSASQATPRTPPVIPPISEPSPSAEPRIAISIIEYRGLCHTLQALATSQSILTQQITALNAHQEQIITTQTQHTAILR
ncbi:hypothetical protein AAG906_016755 [Vitis piasezkii]